MTTSRSSTTRLWFILVALLLLTGVANAGRKRVVVLEFEGDKAEKFHADVVKLIKKSHTVVSVDKWNGTAEEMSATRLTDKNVKKVAKKLKVDGVVSGTVEKRRDEYILRMKLRSGISGEVVGSQVNIKSESARLDGTAARDVKDELIEVIAGLESNRDGGGRSDDDDEDRPKKGVVAKKPAADDEDEDRPKKGAAAKKPAADDDDEDRPKKGAVAKKPADDDDDDDDDRPKKPAGKPAGKKVAARDDDDDDDDGGELEGGTEVSPMEADAMYSPSERAVDAVVGMSFTGRRMAFSYDAASVTQRPAGYSQYLPVPGAYIDATVYPLAVGHKRKDLLRGLGATVMFDRVLVLNSRNPNDGTKLKTTEQRFALGAVFRYPLGSGAKAPVVGAALRYGRQQFTISGTDNAIPNVHYSLFDVSAFFHYPLNPKMVINASAGLLLPTDAGAITKIAEYGRATITGFETSFGLDYLLTKNIFARGEARLETLGYAFKGEGMKSTGVGGARDTYFGGALTAGYLF